MMRSPLICGLVIALALAVAGCRPAPPATAPTTPTPLASDSVLRVHWAGKKSLGIAASAYSLMRLWDAPQSKPLEQQTLAKLAQAPWRLTGQEGNAQAANVLGPLLEEVLREGAFFEARQPGSGPAQTVLAVRLNDAAAERWRVNVAVVAQSLAGVHPANRPGGWLLTQPRSPVRWEFRRAGAWVLLGIGPETNAAFADALARVQETGVPFVPAIAGAWLTVDAEGRWLADALGWTNAPPNLPRVALTITGDGENALTTAEFRFPHGHGLELEPWNIPAGKLGTNFIGFTAVRGLRPWLTNSPAWRQHSLAPPPNQFFAWADRHAPMQMHLLAPDAGAVPFIESLGTRLTTAGNAWIERAGGGNFVHVREANAVVWEQLPLISPFLRASGTGTNALLSGGLIPQPVPATNTIADVYPRRSLESLLEELTAQPDVVACSWETTGERVEPWLLVTQVLRVANRRGQMPAEAASSQWLQASRPRLGNSLTVVTAPAPDRLRLTRSSSAVFTALEWHLVTDWLESPQFPRGTHSLLTPAPAGQY